MLPYRHLLKLGSGLLLASACTLLNQFDDTVPQGGNGGKNSAGTGNEPSDAGEGNPDPLGGRNAGGMGGASDGGGGGKGGTTVVPPGDAGAGAGGIPNEIDAGLLLMSVSPKDQPLDYYLVAMSPEQGTLFEPEKSTRVLGIAYDAASREPDIWYVFVAEDSLDPEGPATLYKRSYNEATGEFRLLGQIDGVPAPKSQNAIVVLNQRILYRSVTKQPGNQTVNGFTLVDTVRMQIRGATQTPDNTDFFGMIAHPAAVSAGGSITLVTRKAADCAAAACPLKARHGTFDKDVLTLDDDAAATTVGSFPPPLGVIIPGFGSASVGVASQRDAYILPSDGLDSTVVVWSPTSSGFNRQLSFPVSIDVDNDPQTMVGETRFSPMAFDPCREILLATPQDAKSLLAITTTDDGAATTRQQLDYTSSRAVYEQYTRTVVTTSENAADPRFDGWTLNGTADSPELVARGLSKDDPWEPDLTMIPRIVVAKTPLKPYCP